MFIRKGQRKHKGKTYTHYALVESYRSDKGPRQRTLCSLGDLRPRPRSEWLKLAHQLEAALVGQGDWLEGDDPEVAEIVRRVQAEGAPRKPGRPRKEVAAEEWVAVCPDRVRTEGHRELGPVHVGLAFWRRLGLDAILAAAGLRPRARLLTCAMVMNRLIAPCSEHAMPEWIRRTALEDLLEVDFASLAEDALYRNLDRLHPARGAIESALVARERTLFNLDATIFLYDLTSTYFEGQALANPKAQRGHSRDKRPDCKQVLVGLVVNRDGFPLAHETFEGHRQDRQTLAAMLDLLAARVGLASGQTVVVDRGMAYEDNLAEIRARGLHYLVASRQPERDQWLAAFAQKAGFREVVRPPSASNRWQKKPPVQIQLQRCGTETVVLCKSRGRIEKDRAIRETHEQRLLADLAKLAKRVERGRLVRPAKIHEAIGRLKERSPRVARYWRVAFDETTRVLTYERDEQRRAKAEQLDGSYLLKTDRDDLTADEIWRIYSLLTRAEAAFRDMKSPLAERPIFHQLERRVDTHIFLCVLAYHLLVAIEKTLRDTGIPTSWETVREALSTHQICTIVLPTDDGAELRLRKPSTPGPQHLELYQALRVPTQAMPTQKTWSRPLPQPV